LVPSGSLRNTENGFNAPAMTYCSSSSGLRGLSCLIL
jgi:hypothetical protein